MKTIMNNTIQDEIFGEITFDGLNWLKTETVSVVFAGNTSELKVEIQSPSLVYDWKRLGRLGKEAADRIFDPNLGGIHYTLSTLGKIRELYAGIFLQGKESTWDKIEETAQIYLSEKPENKDVPFASINEKLSSLQLSVAHVYDNRTEIKFKCDWYEQGAGYFVIADNGEISMRPADMAMERLKDGFEALGFVIKECKQQYFYVYNANIPSKEQVRGMLDLFTGYEEMFFWNYYHKGSVEPGSYIHVYMIDGKPYIHESTHGCGGYNKTIDMDVLIEFIIRNWDKDSDWGIYDHAVAIQPHNPVYLLSDIKYGKLDTFIPDYSATP